MERERRNRIEREGEIRESERKGRVAECKEREVRDSVEGMSAKLKQC